MFDIILRHGQTRPEGLMPAEGSQLEVFDPIIAKAESAWISDVL